MLPKVGAPTTPAGGTVTNLGTLLAAALGLACGPPRSPPPAPPASSLAQDQAVELASGARLTVATGWRVDALPDGVRAVGPEGNLEVHIVEATTSADPDATIAAAWRARFPNVARPAVPSSPAPPNRGWTSVRRSAYPTAPEENRWVEAIASSTADVSLVILLDLPRDHAQRRRSELKVLLDSVMAPGFTPERYTGRPTQPLDAARLDQVRGWIREAQAAAGIPGVAVALFDRDTVLMAEGFGTREVGLDEPVTADTPFLVASNTKPLTTLLLAKLAEEGRFGWETPVTQAYPDFRLGDDATTDRVQIRHLVCACTGLPRQDNEWLFTFHDATPARAMEVLSSMRPTTGFGELYQYSNPLASAAGYVGAYALFPDLELGEAYDRAMQSRVFEPLGMLHTTFDFDQARAAGAASPHGLNPALAHVPITNAINRNVRATRPAGGAWSTVRDYARFGQLELARGRLPSGDIYLQEANIQARHQPQIRIDARSWYGMGLVITDHKGVAVVSHGGSLVGFASNFFLIPEAGVGGVVMTNADIGWTLTSQFSAGVMELLYADDTPEALASVKAKVEDTFASLKEDRPTWQLPVSEPHAAMLAGRYRSDELGGIRVERNDEGRVWFVTDGWTTEVATKRNPDGTLSFVILEPGLLGYAFLAGVPDGMFESLTLHEPQHTYVFEAVDPPQDPR